MASQRRVAITGLGLVTPVGNDVASTLAALLAGRSGGAADQPVRRVGIPGAYRRRGEGLRCRGRHRRPQAAQVRQPLARLCAGGGRAGVCRRRHPPDRSNGDALGLRRGHRHDGRRFCGAASPCMATAPPAANSIPRNCSAMRRPTTRWCSAAASRRPGCRCSRAATAYAATRPPSTPPAPLAVRPSAPRSSSSAAAPWTARSRAASIR